MKSQVPSAKRPIVSSSAFDYENTPGVWVWREGHGFLNVMRVFLSGNRPLDAYGDACDVPGGLSMDEYRQLRLALVGLLYPDSDDVEFSDGNVAIYRNYLRLSLSNEAELDILTDDFLDQVLAVLRPVLGWKEMPSWRPAERFSGFHGSHPANRRWQLGH